MHMDPALVTFTMFVFVIIIVGFLFQVIKQPSVVAYMISGVLLGPFGFNFINSPELISRLGEIGVVLLLFFIGSEISLQKLLENWKIAVVGTVFQTFLSILCTWIMGYFLGWPFARALLLGFVITISSTAVVLKILESRNELKSHLGQNVVNILLVQDLIIIPMLICINIMGGQEVSIQEVVLQILGGLSVFAFLAWIAWKKTIRIPWISNLKKDHEAQVFLALMVCFGFATITGFLSLSTALGAFIGGIFISSSNETNWVHHSLHAFRVVFVAVFFVSIGMLIDLSFIQKEWKVVLILSLAAMFLNTIINAGILKSFNMSWQKSIYGGAMLSQIGEFSFVLIAVGYQAKIINEFGYQATLATIAITLLLSPFWISLVRKFAISETDTSN